MCVCVQVDTVDKIQLEVERNPHTKPAHGHTFSVSVAPRTPLFRGKRSHEAHGGSSVQNSLVPHSPNRTRTISIARDAQRWPIGPREVMGLQPPF